MDLQGGVLPDQLRAVQPGGPADLDAHPKHKAARRWPTGPDSVFQGG